MTKKEKKKLIKEFEKEHTKYSVENCGHWKSNWKIKLKYADLINGCWYWKGYNISELHNNLKK